MVTQMPSSPLRRSALRSRVKPLPPEPGSRRAEPPAPGEITVRCHRIDVDRYEVIARGSTVGYIDVVGPLFVVLAGCRYDHAVEVLQTRDFAAAVDSIAATLRQPSPGR